MSLPLPLIEKHPNETHGMTNTRIYKTWSGMHSRCKCPSATGYENYGGRGISVCERWSSFENFFDDMGNAPDGMSIDRINSNGNYEPGNCKWSTKKEQNRNQSDYRPYECFGKSQCLSAWAEDIGSSYSTLKARINSGWDLERVFSAPVRGHKEYARRSA